MKNRGRKVLTTLLELFLYIIFISGVLFLLLVLGKAPTPLIEWKLIFIITHKILGYIFGMLIIWHCLINWKWYRAWFSGKIKNTKKSLLTKSVSILFVVMIFSSFFEGVFPRQVYACGHGIIGLTWMILMIYHIRAKKSVSKKVSKKCIPMVSS